MDLRTATGIGHEGAFGSIGMRLQRRTVTYGRGRWSSNDHLGNLALSPAVHGDGTPPSGRPVWPMAPLPESSPVGAAWDLDRLASCRRRRNGDRRRSPGHEFWDEHSNLVHAPTRHGGPVVVHPDDHYDGDHHDHDDHGADVSDGSVAAHHDDHAGKPDGADPVNRLLPRSRVGLGAVA